MRLVMLTLFLNIRSIKSYLSLANNCPIRCTTRFTSTSNDHFADSVEYLTEELPGDLNSGAQTISWYPGHIAKAERELSEYLKKVDVVIEVRDIRIPYATTHPSVPAWVGNKPLIVALARIDQVSKQAMLDWRAHYAKHPAHPERPDAKVFFIDGKLGTGVIALKKEALKAGIVLNEKRMRRGIQPRAVRAAIIGFPNVGKSALINRLLNKKMAKSQNLPGVTKSLRWIRLGGDHVGASTDTLELLDSPGIIPAKQFDQNGALKLAICNDIGEASYDRVVVASALCDQLIELHRRKPSYVGMSTILKRFDIPFAEMHGDEIVQAIAVKMYRGNYISAADKLLADFRKGFMQYGSLEAPYMHAGKSVTSNAEFESDHAAIINGKGNKLHSSKKEEKFQRLVKQNDENAVNDDNIQSSSYSIKDNSINDNADFVKLSKSKTIHNLDIGKGSYDGW